MQLDSIKRGALGAVFGASGGTAGMPVWQLGVGV
jgi:hypothetical protein